MKLRDNKGSITIFVLVGLLFMSAFLLLSYGSNVNKSKTAKEMFNIVSDVYSYKDGDQNAYMRAYTAIRKNNVQEMIASSENSSIINLTKTFYGPVKIYRIYGNSVSTRIPNSNYPEVEYLQCGENGVHYGGYVNPNYTLNSSMRIVINFSYTSESSGYKIPFGYMEDGYNFMVGVNPDGYFEFCYGTDTWGTNVTTKKAEIGTKYEIDFSKNGLYIDGELISTVTSEYGNEANENRTIYIGMVNVDGTASSTYSNGDLRIYDAKIYRGEELIADLIPATWGAEGSPIMYNLVDNLFFQGTNMKRGKYYVRPASQDFPMEVQSVGDLVTDTTDENYGRYKIPIKVSTGNLAKLNDGKLGNDYRLIYGIPVKAGQKITYIVNFTHTSSGAITPRLYSDEALSVLTTNFDGITKEQDVVRTITMPSDGYFTFAFGNGLYNTVTFNKLFVALGEFDLDDYREYNETIYNIYLDEPLRKVGDVVDYIDFSTGKVVRQIEEIKSYNGETIMTEWISTTGELGTGATVYYQLESAYNSETIDVPQLIAYEDYTTIEVLTEIVPTKTEVTYDGYTIE